MAEAHLLEVEVTPAVRAMLRRPENLMEARSEAFRLSGGFQERFPHDPEEGTAFIRQEDVLSWAGYADVLFSMLNEARSKVAPETVAETHDAVDEYVLAHAPAYKSIVPAEASMNELAAHVLTSEFTGRPLSEGVLEELGRRPKVAESAAASEAAA